MKIGIDARLWSESGVGRYIRNLVFNLAKIDKENSYFVFLLKKNLGQNLPNNFKEIEVNIGWYGLAEQVKFPKILEKYNLDLVHFPHFNVPIFYTGKFIVTIHDLIHQKFEMKRATTLNPLIYRFKQLGYKKVFKNALVKSEKIIVPSNYVKNELVEIWKVNEKKIVVTHEGVDEEILKLKLQITKQQALENIKKLGVKEPFIFYVGNAHPHKNVEGLIEAFLRAREPESQRGRDLQLVLAGHDHYFWQRVKKQYQVSSIKYQGDIKFLGSISDEELVSLYKTAGVFVMPSFEEGFGIPILEAMACSCPVVSSNAGSLKEVGGDACLYFNPKDLNEMQDKISDVLNNQFPSRHLEASAEGSKDLRKYLIKKGEERYKQFSWKELAKETVNIYSGIF